MTCLLCARIVLKETEEDEIQIFSYSFTPISYQQRIAHIPRAISAAAKINHQNSPGSTSEKIMTNPATSATQPKILRCPLRTTDRLPQMYSVHYTRKTVC